jgi:hypothetical protein
MTLRDIAHARTGDKGDTCNISLVVFDRRDYPRIVERVTPERVRAHFAGIVQGEITRFELPHLGALNFVMTGALRGGVTRSLALDPHGKSLSSLLLNLEM